jgi:hypothetical protein
MVHTITHHVDDSANTEKCHEIYPARGKHAGERALRRRRQGSERRRCGLLAMRQATHCKQQAASKQQHGGSPEASVRTEMRLAGRDFKLSGQYICMNKRGSSFTYRNTPKTELLPAGPRAFHERETAVPTRQSDGAHASNGRPELQATWVCGTWPAWSGLDHGHSTKIHRHTARSLNSWQWGMCPAPLVRGGGNAISMCYNAVVLGWVLVTHGDILLYIPSAGTLYY